MSLNKLKSSAGFTLFELLAVLMIASVLLAAATMSTQGMRQNYQLRAAARKVYGDMQKLRLAAIKQGKEADIAFDAAKDQYTLTFPNDEGNMINRLIDLNEDYGVHICSATDVEFRGNGMTDSNGGAHIRLPNSDRIKRVYVSSIGTGNVRIIDANTCP